MHMMQMLGAITLVFCIALFLMCFFREKLNHPLISPLFIIVCAVFFFCWNYAEYDRGSLKNGFMTLENISPYTCTIILLTPFMHEKVRNLAHCAIAFLGFGMLAALYISPGASYFMSHNYTAKFLHVSEAACHLLMALYGFYLILADRIELTWKNFGKACLFVYSSIGFGVFLNWCFHLGNFGMDMYGNYSIYFMDIFGSFEATIVAYLIGVLGTLTGGFLFGLFLDWLSKPKAAVKTEELPQEVTEEAEKQMNVPQK